MKRIALLLFIALLIHKTYAQAEPANYNIAVTKFKQFYNGGHVDSIFNMFSPDLKTSLPLDKFGPTTTQLRSQFGDLLKTEFVKFDGSLAVYKAVFKANTFLLNLSLNPQNKLNGVFLSPDIESSVANQVIKENTAVKPTLVVNPSPAAVKQTPSIKVSLDPDVVESPIVLKTLSGQISGTLAMPAKADGKVPLVIIVGDAGPTDRNGNNEKAGINGNTYKLLSIGLAKSGIASVRYDKRLVGESVSQEKESQLRIDDYSDDAVSLIIMLNDDQRFSKIILFGHGEGALVCMLASVDQPIKGYISAEGAGEQADKVLLDGMKNKPQYQQDEFKAVLDSLRKGKTIDNVDPAIYYIARPSIQPFLMSWCRIVPIRGIKIIKVPLLLIQGTSDLAVPVSNVEKLKKAKSEANLLIIKGMNHILKDAPADEDGNLATYDKPDLPLSATLVPGIVEFINKLR